MFPGVLDPTQPLFAGGSWGWDTSVWRRLALLWGYTSSSIQYDAYAAPAAGNYQRTVYTVPANYVLVLQHVAARDANNATTYTAIFVTYGGNNHWLNRTNAPAAGDIVSWDGSLVLPSGAVIVCYYNGVANGDNLVSECIGYLMALTE